MNGLLECNVCGSGFYPNEGDEPYVSCPFCDACDFKAAGDFARALKSVWDSFTEVCVLAEERDLSAEVLWRDDTLEIRSGDDSVASILVDYLPIPTIAGERKKLGYQVLLYEWTEGSRYHPPERYEVEVMETFSANEAATESYLALLRREILTELEYSAMARSYDADLL